MRRLQTKDPTLVQELSLFLLLLAFFIVLFNVSRYDSGRADAVGESLSSTFRSTGVPTRHPLQNTSQTGDAPGDELVLEKLSDLVRTEIDVVEVKVLRAGRLLQARFSTDRLFRPGTADLRADRGPLIAKLAGLVGNPAQGRRHKAEIFIGSDWVTPDQIRNSLPLPIERAAAVAERLVGGGALPGTVMGGIRPDDEGMVTILYRIDPEFRPSENTAPPRPAAASVGVDR